MPAEDRLMTTLHECGLRLTRQRQVVWAVLCESQEHLDAETLYTQTKMRDPNISLATVYRTLALFKKIGLVDEHRLGEEHAHYEIVPETPHYHFTCRGCGCVVEFDAPQVAQTVRELGNREGLRIDEVHLLLSGFCRQCQEQEKEG